MTRHINITLTNTILKYRQRHCNYFKILSKVSQLDSNFSNMTSIEKLLLKTRTILKY